MSEFAETSGPAKPSLIVVPENLLRPWVRGIINLTPKLRVYEYHRDCAPSRIGKDNSVHPTKLSRSDPVFNGDNVNRNVIITTFKKLTDGHGTAAQQRWYREEANAGRHIAESASADACPYNLSHRFANVIIVGAHVLQLSETGHRSTLEPLKPNFYVLVTPTPFLNGFVDLGTYVGFTEQKSTTSAMSSLGLSAGAIFPSTIYQLPQDHQGQQLINTQTAMISSSAIKRAYSVRLSLSNVSPNTWPRS